MVFRQLLHTDPVIAASYLLGCAGRGEGVVVDPVDAPAMYLAMARSAGLSIRYVIDTHVHADHVSTGRALAHEAEAAYVLSERAGAKGRVHRVRDGDALSVGNVAMQVLDTPGHTPEHICLLVTDRTRAPEPWLILTGHTLMVGDMGRTELASDIQRGAEDLFASAQRLRSFADYVEVWPGAFAGSVCGRALSGTPASTIGFERRFNRAFQLEDRGAFVRLMCEDIPPPPPRAAENRAANLSPGS